MNDFADWLFKIKNKTLLRVAINLSCVRGTCQFLVEQEPSSEERLGFYELKMLSDAIGGLQALHGNQWENFPFPQYTDEQLQAFNPHPKTLLTYSEILLQYVHKNLSALDQPPAA